MRCVSIIINRNNKNCIKLINCWKKESKTKIHSHALSEPVWWMKNNVVFFYFISIENYCFIFRLICKIERVLLKIFHTTKFCIKNESLFFYKTHNEISLSFLCDRCVHLFAQHAITKFTFVYIVITECSILLDLMGSEFNDVNILRVYSAA